MNAIEMKELSFGYSGEADTLNNINLSIRQGECVLLCGESGCGKTTITKLINGLIPHFTPDCRLKGEVFVNGKNAVAMEIYELARCVGSVFQNPKSQFFNLDTDSELAFGLENRGEHPDYIRKRIDETVNVMHIESLLHRNIFSLSGGEKQTLATAGVYVSDPDIYTLDEPTANLDSQAIDILRQNLIRLKKEGKTIVIAEHRLYFLKDLIDRAVYIKNGEINKIYSGNDFWKIDEEERKFLGLRLLQQTKTELPTATEGHSGLQCKMLSCGYKKHPAVIQDMNFAIPTGKVAAITGANGIGKTTLTRCLCGLLKEESGEIIWNGVQWKAKERQKECYLVMQDVNHQLFSDTVWGECEQMSSQNPEEIEKVLYSLGLLEWKESHPMALSGGQKQRLSVAAAVLSKRKLFIFDEPTSGLDYRNMCRVAELVRNLAMDGHSVIVVTHDAEFMEMACDCEIHLIGNYLNPS